MGQVSSQAKKYLEGDTFIQIITPVSMRFLSFVLNKKRKEREEKTKVTRIIIATIAVVTGLAVVGGIVAAFVILKDLPDIGEVEREIAESTVILDRNGNELYKVFNDENRIYVPLTQVSDIFIKAILAAEDRKFYAHPGFDIMGIVRAQLSNLQGNNRQGASTISQQVVKNLITRDKTQSYVRKLREAVLAYQLEQKYPKDKILEFYVNQSPFGGNSYGIQTAARNFFNKDAKDLNLPEAAVLASLPNGPSLYSPFGQNVELLMGYCKVGGEAVKNVGEIETVEAEGASTSNEIVITAREKVWLKITAVGDGKVAYVGTLEKGDQTSFPATGSYTIATGNKNFDMYVGSAQVELPRDATFTFDTASYTKKDGAAVANTPKTITASSGDASVGCSSMDDPNYMLGRKDLVLQAMLEENFITREQRDDAWKQSHNLVFNQARESIKYPHFVMFVREYLEQKYGEDVGSKGFIVKTTIDPELQDIAQEIVKRKGDAYAKNNKIGNAALVSVDPNTGEILAMVGSRDYWDAAADGNVNVTVRKRQPGSSFKPFIFAQLFEGQWGAGSVMWDVKTRFGGSYPNNYEGGFKGPMTIRSALAASRNIPPIKAYFLNDGEEKTLDFLAKVGFPYLKSYAAGINEGRSEEEKFYYGYPIAIGSGEVRPLDMATGYAAFANGGKYIEPSPILEITTAEGEVIESMNKDRGVEVMDPQIAYQITDILSDANARPAGFWRTALSTPGVVTAAKTGTSNKRFGNTVYPSDLWTVGYSRSISTAVWVGNNDGSRLAQSQDGLNFAAPIWKEFMMKAHDNREKSNFEQPDGIVRVTVSTLSGKRASKTTPPEFTTTDIFSSWAAPKEFDSTLIAKKVDKRNGLLAGAGCSEEITETVYAYNVHSERPNLKDWETPVLAWAAGKGFGNGETKELPKNASDCKPVSESDKTQVVITYPKDGGLVKSGPVSVRADIQAPFGLSKVEYYVNGALATTRSADPFNTGAITIPASGETHTIKVIAYDKGGQSATSSIAVKTGVDTSNPIISLSSPKAGMSLQQGSSLPIAFSATDADSPLSRVEVYIDNTLVKTVGDGEHSFSVVLQAGQYSVGAHTLKVFATDALGNSSSAQASFTVRAGRGADAGDSETSAGDANTNLNTSTTTPAGNTNAAAVEILDEVLTPQNMRESAEQ